MVYYADSEKVKEHELAKFVMKTNVRKQTQANMTSDDDSKVQKSTIKTRVGLITLRCLHNCPNLTGSGSYDPGKRHDGFRVRMGCVAEVEARDSIKLPILQTGMVGKGVGEATQKQRSSGLAGV